MVYESKDMTASVRLPLAGLIVVALAACSSSASPSVTTAPSPPAGVGFTAVALCALVTPADVSAALGSTVGAGVPSGVNAPSCTWQDPISAAGATIAATDPGSVGQIPFGLQGISGAHVTAVPGVGDAAFFAAGASGPNTELDISKGGRAITITVGIPGVLDQATVQAAELAIGQAAAKNM
ncbi:MAG: hypothetical protein ACHQ3P_01005 [Candidatus Limnocylindrales bacterium]